MRFDLESGFIYRKRYTRACFAREGPSRGAAVEEIWSRLLSQSSSSPQSSVFDPALLSLSLSLSFLDRLRTTASPDPSRIRIFRERKDKGGGRGGRRGRRERPEVSLARKQEQRNGLASSAFPLGPPMDSMDHENPSVRTVARKRKNARRCRVGGKKRRRSV